MTITIDGKELFFSTYLLIQNGQEALIDIPLEDDASNSSLRIGLTFLVGKPDEPQKGTWDTVDEIVKFTLVNWNNPLGSCTTEPVKFAEVGNKKVYFHLASNTIGEQNLAHLWLLFGNGSDVA